ncbi:ATP-binding protein [Dictyobacter formicarum]|uniref:NACHT domain-containing protein n=1 Tax=Dictyobacter formicarum TaxID=2778368 RepID=A0ABQ3VRQ6_9CHLR|nr:ATP-binding protein [Dictyobacter formicarum]GHO88513.1 hypothetical protein KSZ_65190 [Dictyobacter formicarum]
MDDYQQLKGNYLNAIINTFTQGLRALPTDAVTRVKNFLVEYLGKPEQPVPFGGRERDFRQLDDWLEDALEPPYLLLAAPAGRGKSALLLRWCQQLFKRRDLAIVYFPVSIRFRTNLAGVTFPALATLLATLHGEQIPKDPNLSEEFWRSLLSDYIMRPLPDGRRLLLVLDGVDEAADWTAGPELFPDNPPPGLRIVLSARLLANDQGASNWLQRLGWTRAGLARTLELLPLDRPGIASVLQQMGFPLDLLSARFDIITELYRLSEGDPLLIRLYVDDLWKRGDAVMHFTLEDLRAIHPGLEGYFERWWKEQRQLWSQDAPQREAAVQLVLNLLACALGPLSKQDIMSLVIEDAPFSDSELEQHLSPLARFVTGDGIHQGYVFSHPRLGNYFYEERLSDVEKQEIEQRFLNWGAQTLTALNEVRLMPEQASAYIVQYYGAHLERTQANAATLLTLVSNGWRRAWEKLDRAQAGFLGDIDRAWQAIKQVDLEATKAGERAPYVGEEIQCLLCQVSVNSMTSSISARLMLEAVKTGTWTPAQGLACLRLIPDLATRASELVALAPYVQEPVRTDILHEALDTTLSIKDEYTRFDTMITMAPGLSEDLLFQILDTTLAIEDEADRAGILAELAPSLAPYPVLLDKAITLAKEIEDEEYQALAYEGLAAHGNAKQQQRILELAQEIREERYKVPVLIALIPHMPENSLPTILEQANNVLDGLSRMRLLTELIIYLPEQWRAEALAATWELEQSIDDHDYRIEVLVKLAPYLASSQIKFALHEARTLWDERAKGQLLMALVPYIADELLSEFLQTILAMKSDEECSAVLLPLLPRLEEEQLAQVLERAQSIWDEGCRASLLAATGPYLPEKLLPRLFEILHTLGDPGYCVWLLAELEGPLQGKLADKQYNISAVFQAMTGREERLQTLLAIAPRLSDEALERLFNFMLPEIFDFTWQVHSEERSANILTKLGRRLPRERLDRALETVQSFFNESYQAQVLTELAPRLYGSLLTKALDIVRGMKERDKRAQVLEVLVSTLPEERKGERVQEILQVLQLIKDENERTRLIVACLSLQTTTLPPEQEEIILNSIQTLTETRNQGRGLQILAAHLRPEAFKRVLSIVENLRTGEEQAQALEALAPYVPENVFAIFSRQIFALQYSRWRTTILAKAAPHLEEKTIDSLMEMAFLVPNQEWREEILEVLAPYIPEAYFRPVWESALSLNNRGRQFTILKALAPRIPDNFFPVVWDAISVDGEKSEQWWILKALAPHLTETIFMQTWEAALNIENASMRAQALYILAPYLPTQQIAQVWHIVSSSTSPRHYWGLLERLAPRVPEEHMARFFDLVQGITQEDLRIQVLSSLIPRLPAALWLQLWEMLPGLRTEQSVARLVVTMLPRVSADTLSFVWDILREIDNSEQWIFAAKAFLPYATPEQIADILKRVLTLPYGDQQVNILESLASYLTETQNMDTIKVLLALQEQEKGIAPEGLVLVLQEQEKGLATWGRVSWNSRWRVRLLAILMAHLPRQSVSELIPILFAMLQNLKAEEDRVWVLKKLAVALPEESLEDVLEMIWAMTSRYHREQALKDLQRSTSATGRAKILEAALAQMRKTEDVYVAIQVLQEACNGWGQTERILLSLILNEALHLLARQTRREALPRLIMLLPAIAAAGNERALMEVGKATLEIGSWWP